MSLGRVLRYPGQRAGQMGVERKGEGVVREKYELFGAFFIDTSLFRGIFLNYKKGNSPVGWGGVSRVAAEVRKLKYARLQLG